MKRTLFVLAVVWILMLPVMAQEQAIEVVNVVEIETAAEMDALRLYPLVVWSPDGKRVAIKDVKDSRLHILDAATGEDLASLDVFGISAFAFNQDGSLLSVAGGGLLVFVLDVQAFTEFGDVTEDTLLSAIQEGVIRNLAMINVEKSFVEVISLAISGDSSLLFADTMLDGTYAWDIREAADFSTLSESSNPNDIPFASPLEVDQDLSFWPHHAYPVEDGILALTVESENEQTAFALKTLKADFDSAQVVITDAVSPIEINVPRSAINEARLNAATGLLVIATEEEMLLVRADGSTSSISYPDTTPDGLRAVEISADGGLVTAYWSDKSLRFWDTEKIEEVFVTELNIPPVRLGSFVYSPDNRKLLIAAPNGIQIWELSGALVQEAAVVTAVQAATPVPDSTCEIDLNSTITILEQAQDAATSGDSSQAIQLMAEARVQLENFESQCSSTNSNLPDTYILQLELGELTFKFPDGWFAKETENFGVVVGSTESALEVDMTSPEPPEMSAGDNAIIVNLVDAGFFGATDLSNASPQELLTQVMRQSSDSIGAISAVTSLTIDDRAAAIAQIDGDSYELVFLMIDSGLKAANGDTVFVMLVGISEPDAIEALENTTLAIAETVEVEP